MGLGNILKEYSTHTKKALAFDYKINARIFNGANDYLTLIQEFIELQNVFNRT